MNASYEHLFSSIRARCEQKHWFGPDLGSPARRKRVSADDPRRFNFLFPAANGEQLYMTEVLLGFPLPPLLRSLYAQMANGGFGPGGGLKGIVGGYGSVESGTHTFDTETIIDQYRWRCNKGIFDLAEDTGRDKLVSLEVSYGEWLRSLLPICNLGCVQEACLASQERMFIVAPLEGNELYWLRQLPWTFEQWLWRWIRDEALIPMHLEAEPPSEAA